MQSRNATGAVLLADIGWTSSDLLRGDESRLEPKAHESDTEEVGTMVWAIRQGPKALILINVSNA
jgi:hypothetical protein